MYRVPMLRLRPQFWLALLIQSVGLCAVLVWWIARGQAVALVELPAIRGSTQQENDQTHMLPCVSYSPFHHGDINPFNYRASVSPAQIEADLSLLRTRTNCIRTYGLNQGLDAVPEVAARLGMRVNLGIWLSRDPVQNQAQLQRGLQLAHQYKGIINRLVVGNEVLLRREMTPQALGQFLYYAKQYSPVPVTYADVWEFWLRNAQLAQHVDLVTVHILPYWEDEPVAVSDAVTHVLNIAEKVKKSFSGKPVWVGETGWPAAGRQRAGAVPGQVEQARFLRELLVRTSGVGGAVLDYNFIEAFDQPWKRSFEGAMGGYWGLFDPQGQPHAALRGAVTEDAKWWRGMLGAMLGGLIGWLLAALLNMPLGMAVLSFATLGAVVPVQWLMVQQWDRSIYEQCISAVIALVSALATMTPLVRWLAVPRQVLARHSGVKSKWIFPENFFDKLENAVRFALLFTATTAALVLLLDSRYRPFPWWWFVAPAFSLLARRVSGQVHVASYARKQQLLACVLAFSAILIVLTEGGRNTQALIYCSLLLMLAGTAAWPSRAKTSSANSKAGVHSSVV